MTERALDRTQWLALVAGVLALLLCVLLGRHAPRQALLSYLFGFVFVTGVSVGSLAIAMVHVLTGGAWGYLIRPYLMAAARVLPLQAVLSLPLLIGQRVIYPWADAANLARDSVLRAQSWYLNPTFFTLRTLAYFAIWWLFAAQFQRLLARPERLPRIAAPALIVCGITGTLAAVDWAMSLLPHWHSTVFGLMVFTGWMLSAAALATLCVACCVGSRTAAPKLLRDLGNLLLALVLGWSYLEFMQYLTVWIADLPADTIWYIPRTLTSWRGVSWFLIACDFAIPFALLLSRRAKGHRRWLGAIAALLLIAQCVDALWLVLPSRHPAGLDLHWSDLAAPAGLGALCLCWFFGRLRTRSALG